MSYASYVKFNSVPYKPYKLFIQTVKHTIFTPCVWFYIPFSTFFPRSMRSHGGGRVFFSFLFVAVSHRKHTRRCDRMLCVCFPFNLLSNFRRVGGYVSLLQRSQTILLHTQRAVYFFWKGRIQRQKRYRLMMNKNNDLICFSLKQ